MHHFIYPSQDTFITNVLGFEKLNFGIDEILRIGTSPATVAVQVPVEIGVDWEQLYCPSASWDMWNTPWGQNPTGSYEKMYD